MSKTLRRKKRNKLLNDSLGIITNLKWRVFYKWKFCHIYKILKQPAMFVISYYQNTALYSFSRYFIIII